MKKQLAGYYELSQVDYNFLWENGLIILDTNVLLNLYSSSPTTRKDLMDTLRYFSTRLWMPYQVKWEFQRKRDSKIEELKNAYYDLISCLERDQIALMNQLSQYPFIDTKEFRDQISTLYQSEKKELQDLEKSHPDYSSDDPIQSELTVLFERKIGEKYPEQTLQEFYKIGEERYKQKIPPGFEDNKKSKRSNNDLYGDLIIWFEIIDKARSSKKPIIFVTDDEKEDWWFIKKGKKYGARPELIEELQNKANVFFWIYSSDRFLVLSRDRIKEPLDQGTLSEIRDITEKEEIETFVSDEIVNIRIDRDSFVIGRTVEIFGISYNKGGYVHLVLFGPDEYSEGVEIATPHVSDKYKWRYLWDPGFSIPAGKYTFVVSDPDNRNSDDVSVKAEKGSITIVSAGAQNYYIGEKIKFSGISTASNSVFLAIQIAGLNHSRKLDDPSVKTHDDTPSSFLELPVRSDCTWSYIWDTSLVGKYLRAGTHTIYAVESPFSPETIENKAFGSVSIIIKKPYISCMVSQSVVAQGNQLIISGMAEGISRQKIQIWIFGDAFNQQEIIHADSDSSFLFKLLGSQTKKMRPGKYYVVVQHPMLDNEFGVYLDESRKIVLTNSPKPASPFFSIDGPDSVHGAKAAEALVETINKTGTDDTYTKCMFVIEPPMIRFNPVNNRYIGEKFTISASTNLSVDSEISIQVISSSFDPNKEKQSKEMTGAVGTVKVARGNSGMNQISFDVDSSTFLPDEYTVKASVVKSDLIASATFNIFKRNRVVSFFRRIFQ